MRKAHPQYKFLQSVVLLFLFLLFLWSSWWKTIQFFLQLSLHPYSRNKWSTITALQVLKIYLARYSYCMDRNISNRFLKPSIYLVWWFTIILMIKSKEQPVFAYIMNKLFPKNNLCELSYPKWRNRLIYNLFTKKDKFHYQNNYL